MTTIERPTGHAVPGIDPADAVEVLPEDADRWEWLQTRRTGIGGSDVSAMLRMSPYEGPLELWLDKTGQTPLLDEDDEDGPRFWGQVLEPVIRDVFARRVGLAVSTVGTLRSVRWPHMLANLDGLVADGANLEIKTAGLWMAGEWADEQVSDHAELQAQWGMAVSGRSRCWVCAFIGGQKLAIRQVQRDEAFIAWLVEQGEQFWTRHVLADDEPEPGGAPGTSQFLTGQHPEATPDSSVEVDADTAAELAGEYRAGKAAENAGKAQAAAAANKARRLLGPAEQLVVGEHVVADWRNTGQLDLDRLTTDHPGLVAEHTRDAPAFDAAGFAEQHPDLYRTYRGRRLLFKKG